MQGRFGIYLPKMHGQFQTLKFYSRSLALIALALFLRTCYSQRHLENICNTFLHIKHFYIYTLPSPHKKLSIFVFVMILLVLLVLLVM